MDYQKQGENFLENTKTKMTVSFVKNGFHFSEDTEKRDIYNVTFERGASSYSFNFGQSIMNSTKYEDRLNKNQFSASGQGLNCNLKVVHHQFFKDYCKEIKGTPPTAYDILAGITKDNPGNFQDFCDNFGYDTDSIKAKATYEAVVNEWLNVAMLWNEKELDELREIQ